MENQIQLRERNTINSDCACFNMRKLTRAVTQYFDRYLEPAGIRATQFTLLVELSSSKAKTLTQIADNLVMDRTTLTRNLKPLEKLELITTVQTSDKRSKAYALTEKGNAVLNRSIPMWERAQNKITDNLGDSRYQGILSELNALLNLVSDTKQ